MSETTAQPPEPKSQGVWPQPELQFAVYVGDIGPNDTDNVFSDYQKLIMFCARRITPENAAEMTVNHATEYMLFGSRDGHSYTKHVDKAGAERFMVGTFIGNMKRQNVTIIDAQPLRPL